MSLAYSCPHSSPHAHLLPSASLLTLTQLPRALVSLSVTVYTIPVATSYSFFGTLLLLVLCCTIAFVPLCFCVFCFFPHSSFSPSSVSLHLFLPSPITHYVHSSLSTPLFPFVFHPFFPFLVAFSFFHLPSFIFFIFLPFHTLSLLIFSFFVSRLFLKSLLVSFIPYSFLFSYCAPFSFYLHFNLFLFLP